MSSLFSIIISLCVLVIACSFLWANKRERERKRKRKGALYDDDVNDDDDVLRDDDDDAKNRPAYAPRADDASQSAPELYSGGDGGGAFR